LSGLYYSSPGILGNFNALKDYFPYEEMESFIRKISGVLNPGAKWVINTGLGKTEYRLGDMQLFLVAEKEA
jgi:hypothetical protein